MRPFRTSAPLVVALILTSAASAAPTTVAPLDELSLEELGRVRVDTVEGASRYRQKITEAPAAVSIVTAQDIRTFGWRTMAELLQAVRGQSISYDRTYSYLGSRGFARPGDYNARNLFLINGQRFNDPIYDGAVIDDGFAVDLGLVDRVEIIRGPTSSIYGNSAFFGVINVVTRRGDAFAPSDGSPGGGGEVEVGVGSLGTTRGRVTAGGRLAGGTSLLVSASGSHREGNPSLYYAPFDEPGVSDGIAHDADAESTRSAFLSLQWHDLTFEAGYTSRTKHIPTASFGTIFDDSSAAGVDETGWAQLSFERQLQPDLQLRATLSTNIYNYDGTYPFTAEDVDRTGPAVRVKDYADAGSVTASVQATKVLAARHTLLAGLDFKNDQQQDQGNYVDDPVTVNYAGRDSTTSLSPYVQGDFLVSRDLTFTAGVRLDHFSTFGDSINPRVGVIWHPRETSTLKLLTGTAFRAPNPYEYSYNDGDRTFRANPDLDPEDITTSEIIWEEGLGRHARATISLYQYRITNLIDLAMDPGSELLYFDNVESVRSRGVEGEIETWTNQGWMARASFSFNDTRDRRTDTRLTRAPRVTGALHLAAPIANLPLRVALETLYNSERESSTGNAIEAYWLCNLTLSTQELASGVTLGLTLRNLFDTSYADPASDEHVQSEIPQDGRTLLARATWRF